MKFLESSIFLGILLFISFITLVVGKTEILVPLYSYPTSDQWATLKSSAFQYPSLTFIVIVNPNSGPGSSPPNSDWVSGMRSLNSIQNIKTIGYVYTNYGRRSTSTVKSDVAAYAAWPSGAAPSGIFFDQVATDAASIPYYSDITTYTRSTFPNGLVFFNPGTVPNTNNYFSLADQVVIHEEPYRRYKYPANAKVPSGVPYSQFSVIVYSIPSNNVLASLVNTMVSAGYGSMYLTKEGNQYNSFGSSWNTFLSLVYAAEAGGTG